MTPSEVARGGAILHRWSMKFDPGAIGRPNPLHPNHMTAEERLAELGQILARGLIRLHAQKSSALSADRGDNSVDFSPDQSGHAVTPKRRKA